MNTRVICRRHPIYVHKLPSTSSTAYSTNIRRLFSFHFLPSFYWLLFGWLYLMFPREDAGTVSSNVTLLSLPWWHSNIFFFFLNLFYYMTPHKCGGKKTTYQCWTSLSTMSTLGIYFKSSDWATRTLAILLALLFCFVMLSSGLYFSGCVTHYTIFTSHDQGSFWSSEISVTSVPKRVNDKTLPLGGQDSLTSES